jgi:hypothetical protein
MGEGEVRKINKKFGCENFILFLLEGSHTELWWWRCSLSYYSQRQKKAKQATTPYLLILDAHIPSFASPSAPRKEGRKEELARLFDHFFIERRRVFIRLV